MGTYNIYEDKMEKAVSEKTKAIIIAYSMVNPFNLDAVMEVSNKYILWVIKDKCDALCAKYNRKLTGSLGHIGTSSIIPLII